MNDDEDFTEGLFDDFDEDAPPVRPRVIENFHDPADALDDLWEALARLDRIKAKEEREWGCPQTVLARFAF